MDILHITIYEGSKFTNTFEYLQDGSPVNLTGYSALFAVHSASRDAPILTATTTNGRLSINPTLGKITVTIPATTELTTEGLYRYTLEITPSSGAGDTVRIAQGDCRIILKNVNTYL